ncbi:MAG: DUF1501 domain-containing protein [Phycisphaeraceae bacterium]
MSHHATNPPTQSPASRRQFLFNVGGGFGGLAIADLLHREQLLARSTRQPLGVGTVHRNDGGLHRVPKIKRVVQLFMNGGASPMDLFDYKPRLEELHGQRFDPGGDQRVEGVTGQTDFTVMKSPFKFRRYGHSGRWVSEVFPHIATCVDDLAFLMSMVSKSNVHGPASYMQNTGFVDPGFPAMGAWVSYGLGSVNDNLPAFVVLPDPAGLPYNNRGNFESGFLPVRHQGMLVRPHRPQPVAHLQPPAHAEHINRETEDDGYKLLRMLNEEHAADRPGDTRLESRIASYELAARMQLNAADVFDIENEPSHAISMYGADAEPTQNFGRNCLIARRLLERGVRFVQVWNGPGGPTNNWDNHGNIPAELPPRAAETDKPTAALVRDLQQRGLWDDTLIIWTTEFGRQPFSQGQAGRDHNRGTFVSWLGGGPIKPGVAYGQSDEWAWKSLKPTWCYDLHATILHLMGIDHTRLTFRHNGIDRRLTDVHGHVIHEILV